MAEVCKGCGLDVDAYQNLPCTSCDNLKVHGRQYMYQIS